MTIEEPLEITIEVTRKEIDDLFDLRFDRASFLTSELRSLIERIREEYYAHIDTTEEPQ